MKIKIKVIFIALIFCIRRIKDNLVNDFSLYSNRKTSFIAFFA